MVHDEDNQVGSHPKGCTAAASNEGVVVKGDPRACTISEIADTNQSSSSATTGPENNGTRHKAPSDPHPRHHTPKIPPSACDTPSLFVGGLHHKIGDLHLEKLFSPYGTIVRIHVATHNPSINTSGTQNKAPRNNPHSKSQIPSKYVAGLHQSKGYAFVEYNSVESARMAISRLDGRVLMGKTLAVRPSRRKKSDGLGSSLGGSGVADKGSSVTVEEARREYGTVQSKIEILKRAIEEKKKREMR